MASTGRPDPGSWDAYAVEIGLRLARARQRTGLSQEKVAHRAGLTGNTLHKLEKGITRPGVPMNPKLRTLLALAQALDVEVTELLPPAPPGVVAN